MSNREYWKQELVGRMESFTDEEIKQLGLDKITPEDADKMADMVMANEELWEKIEENLIDIIKIYCYNKLEQQAEEEYYTMSENEKKIVEIIEEVWNNETEENGDNDPQIGIYLSYITAYGYKPQEVIDFAEKYGIIYDPNLLDPEDEYDIYGSLVINSDSIKEFEKHKNKNS